MLSDLTTNLSENWLSYGSIPVIAAVIAYVTNVLAVKMVFYPLEFVGKPPVLGWQGIVPRFAPRMAMMAMDLMLGRLVTPQEVFARIDVDVFTTRLKEPINEVIDDLTRELLAEYAPNAWGPLPPPVKELVIRRVQSRAPALIESLLDELSENVESVLDMKGMAVNALIRDKALMVRLMQEMGKRELKFLVNSGLVFGFVLGVVQVFVWAIWEKFWLLPVFGFLSGYISNYLALTMIFRPVERKRYFGFPWQGMFHARRSEVAKDYGDMIANEILSPENILEALLTGSRSDRLFAMIEREVTEAVDQEVGVAKPLVVALVGGPRYAEMKQHAVRLILEQLPERADELGEVAKQEVDVSELVVEKMELLTADEYENLLRPAFKQDEWKLILVGGVLGAVIGAAQGALILV